MESIDTLLILLLSVAIVIVVVACVVIFNRMRQVQSAADKVRGKGAEEQHRDTERQAAHGAKEEERQRAEAERRRPEEDLRRAEQERHYGEEERGRLDEEAKQKTGAQCQTDELREAAEDQERCEAHEAQPEAEELQVAEEEHRRPEEEGRCVPEETHREQEERRKRLEEERGRKVGEVRQEIETETKRLEPIKRGGRPRTSIHDREEQLLRKRKPRCPKPEIVCWKRERQWIPSVEVPEELLASPNLAVLQNGLPLTQDESREGCWCLKEAYGQVVVQWKEDEVAPEINKIPLGEESYLLFKLSGQDQNQGRRVKSPSSGSYLVMVPDKWERDETLSGPPPVAPESVSLPGYMAHYFNLEKDADAKIAFLTPEGPVVIEPNRARFELAGNRLEDATQNIGPLFGERPPQIGALQEHAWRNVGSIVVGEEGSSRRRWRKEFTPDPEATQQDLPSEVVARKGGMYFLRFYDTKNDLIESLDFRFICALKEIRILQPSPFPSEGRHGPVRVEFLHEPGCSVQLSDDLANIQIEHQGDKTILTIPPDPTYDETQWLVGAEGGPQIEVAILVERLWWGIGEEQNAPPEWKDQPLALLRDDFSAASMKAIWLRLPRRRWVDKVLVGFEQSKARPYDLKVTERAIAVPLREFGDSEEVGDRTQEHSLKVWIERGGSFIEGVVAVIPALVAPVSAQAVSHPTPHRDGFGRKKTAIARAVLREGTGVVKVNGQPVRDYFKKAPLKARRFLWRLFELPTVSEVLSQMEVSIEVTGSSPTTMRQAKAVAHALARALMSYDPKMTLVLKQAGFGGVRVKRQPACNGRGNR